MLSLNRVGEAPRVKISRRVAEKFSSLGKRVVAHRWDWRILSRRWGGLWGRLKAKAAEILRPPPLSIVVDRLG